MEPTNSNQDKSSKRRNWDSDCSRSPEERLRISNRRRVAFGSAILLIGAWWLLDKMDIIYIPSYIFTWPVLLMGIGLISLFVHRFKSGFGFIALIVGGMFFARNQFDIPITIGEYFWPIVFIALGAFILFRPKRRNRFNRWREQYRDKEGTTIMDESISEDSNDTITETVIMGGVKKDVLSKSFRGGTITCVAGGCDLYLGNADIQGDAVIDVSLLMGGVKLTVPRNWEVSTETTNVLGGVEDKRRIVLEPDAPTKRLIITGSVVMGGIEIQST